MSVYKELKRGSLDVSEPFYFGYMSRKQAEDYLYKNSKKAGSYLLRDHDTGFRISLVVKTKFGLGVGIAHYLVYKDDQKNYYLYKNILFSSIYDLIEHYSKKDCGLPSPLKIPCMKKSASTSHKHTGSGPSSTLPTKMMLSGKSSMSTIKKVSSMRQPDEKKRKYTSMGSVPDQKMQDREKFLMQRLSSGQHATLWKGKFLNKHETVVFKMSNDKTYNNMLQEQAGVMQLLRHEYIVEMMELVCEKQPYIVLKYCANKDISNFLLASGNYEAEYSQRQRMAAEVANALNFVAKSGFVHRNVKSSNVLVNQDLSCKLSGFSYIKKLNYGVYYQQQGDMEVAANNIPWMAPEVFSGGEYSTASDVWAFASFVFELFTNGEAPFLGLLLREIGDKVMEGMRPSKPEPMPDNVYELLLAAWDADPNMRPSFSELEGLIHPHQTKRKCFKQKSFDNEIYEDMNYK